VTARTAEFRTIINNNINCSVRTAKKVNINVYSFTLKWRRFVCVARRLSRRVTIVNSRVKKRSSNGAGSTL